MRKTLISLILAFLAVSTKAALPVLQSQTTAQTLLNYYSDATGKLRIDTPSNRFVFGSTVPASGAVLTASGTAVFQSTQAASGAAVADFRNNAGVSIFKITQGGSVVTSSTFSPCNFISSASVVGVSTYTFTGFDTYAYMQFSIRYQLLKHTAGILKFIFNSDTGTNYIREGFLWTSGGSSPFGGTGQAYFAPAYDTGSVGSDDNTAMNGWIDFSTDPNASTNVLGKTFARHTRSAAQETDATTIEYDGSRLLERISVFTSAGTMDGTFTVYACRSS